MIGGQDEGHKLADGVSCSCVSMIGCTRGVAIKKTINFNPILRGLLVQILKLFIKKVTAEQFVLYFHI